MNIKILQNDPKGYKYELLAPIRYQTEITGNPFEFANHMVRLTKEGMLILAKGFKYDGPSGPTIDTVDSMAAAGVHDGLYRAMRRGKLSRKWRRYADKLLRVIGIRDGMPKWRAWYWYWAVRIGARRSSFPGGGIAD